MAETRHKVGRVTTDEDARELYARLRAGDDPPMDPRSRARLLELGLLDPDTGTALSPAVAIRRILAAVTNQQQNVMALVEQYLQAAAPPSVEDVSAEFVAIEGVQEAIDQIIVNARNETLSMHPAVRWTNDSLRRARDRSRTLRPADVVNRALYQQQMLRQPEFREYARDLAAQPGRQLRFAPYVPIRMLVFDRHTAVLQQDPADLDTGALVVRSPVIVGTLAALFDYCWVTASDASEVPGESDDLPDQQRTILRMLATGATDDVIARNLGVSTRTVTRLIGELLTKLGASSRFQAGLRAGRLGWLD